MRLFVFLTINNVCFQWFGLVTEKKKKKNEQIDEYKMCAVLWINVRLFICLSFMAYQTQLDILCQTHFYTN